ncbi:MAG TPA: hypothetical protein VF100_12735, partial [Thermoanaerobaculia bacterium]
MIPGHASAAARPRYAPPVFPWKRLGGASWPAAAVAVALVTGSPAAAVEPAGGPPPLVDEAVVAALADEVSGSVALHTAEELALHHRQRGSTGYHAAAEAVRRRLVAAGLDDV